MIEVNNLTTSEIDEDFIRKIAEKVLKEELETAKQRNIELSVAFIGSGRMRKLNKKYRGKNKVTDVLSFGEGLREVVICLREVKKSAQRFKVPFEKELARILIHGILHLLGYEHDGSDEAAEKKRKKEKCYLNGLV